MKRRAFFSALAGLCAAPAVAALPKTPVPCETVVLDDLIPECGLDWRDVLEQRAREVAMLKQLDAYTFAEWRAATIASIAAIFAVPPRQLQLDLNNTRYDVSAR